MKKIMLVFGTRPEAIKMAPLVKEFQKHPETFQTIVCVTGQHREMLDQVLHLFGIKPDYDLNIMSWKQVKVYPSLLNDNNILFDESYFKDAEGNEVVRSFYEFVRDHLGYRLNLQSESTVEAKNGNLEYNLTITNTGFATVINPKEVYLVLVSGDGQVAKEIKLDVDPKTWIPSTNEEPNQVAKYVIKGSAAAGLSGTYKVGIWMPEKVADLKYNPAYAIKFAPTEKLTHWYDDAGKYAVNIFGEVTF